MQHYHVNRNAYFNENMNKNINQDINQNIHEKDISQFIIQQNNNFINLSIDKSTINNIIYIQKIYNQIFFVINNSDIFDIFLINKNINISELINYIYLKSIKINIKNIYILSVENI